MASRHRNRETDVHEAAARHGGIVDVRPQPAKGHLAERHGEQDAHHRHPERHGRRQDERVERRGDQHRLAHGLALGPREGSLAAEAGHAHHHEQREAPPAEEVPAFEEEPAVEVAPSLPETAKDGEGVTIDVDRRARLRVTVASDAINHPERLRVLLETAPEEDKPALLRAIAKSEAGYEKVLKSLD